MGFELSYLDASSRSPKASDASYTLSGGTFSNDFLKRLQGPGCHNGLKLHFRTVAPGTHHKSVGYYSHFGFLQIDGSLMVTRV